VNPDIRPADVQPDARVKGVMAQFRCSMVHMLSW
jgi:hypothetical protein